MNKNHIRLSKLWWSLISQASPLFAQPLVQARIKVNSKALRHWTFWWVFTRNRWIPAQKASNVETFPFDDVIRYSVDSIKNIPYIFSSSYKRRAMTGRIW